jgi:hypothetical protein
MGRGLRTDCRVRTSCSVSFLSFLSFQSSYVQALLVVPLRIAPCEPRTKTKDSCSDSILIQSPSGNNDGSATATERQGIGWVCQHGMRETWAISKPYPGNWPLAVPLVLLDEISKGFLQVRRIEQSCSLFISSIIYRRTHAGSLHVGGIPGP